jgi:hypothetical protein
MLYPTRASEFDYRRLQVPPSPLHDHHLINFTLARAENVSVVSAVLDKDIRVSGLAWAIQERRAIGRVNILRAAQRPLERVQAILWCTLWSALRTAGSAPNSAGYGSARPPKLQRQEALQRLAEGESQADVARAYNIDPAAICRLARL